MQTKIDLFSKLFREIEAEIGTRDLSELVLKALKRSLNTFCPDDFEDFCKQFGDLVHIISNTEPKFGVLNNYFLNLKRDFTGKSCPKLSKRKVRRLLAKKIDEFLKNSRKEAGKLIEYADKINVHNKTILIHNNSHTVQDVLRHYKRKGKKFKVVIAEQDYEKTHNNIECMHNAGIPFQVVPSYMLSHIQKNIDMVFFGALTLKDTMHFVMNPGTHGVISEFHVEKIPVHIFINTDKFSLWKSKPRGEIFIHHHTRKHYSKPIEYKRIKYSHDRVPAELFTKIITNEGIFTPAGLKKLFEEKMKEYKEVMG